MQRCSCTEAAAWYYSYSLQGYTLCLVSNCSKSPAQFENGSSAFVTRDNTSNVRKIEFQGASKERQDYLQQKMKKPEEDDNEEFDILISFCFNLKECRDALRDSGILQAGTVFLAFLQAPSETSGKSL